MGPRKHLATASKSAWTHPRPKHVSGLGPRGLHQLTVLARRHLGLEQRRRVALEAQGWVTGVGHYVQ